ncbi:MAG: class I SAM-dependent methyltransferase [Steroidobacteraceae bacterium]
MPTHGDFTGFADDHAKFRPGYAPPIATAILGFSESPRECIDAADIGAGTGIWTRILSARGLRSVAAVEPSDEMIRQGIVDSRDAGITWQQGSAEATGLPAGSVDLVTVASALHWVDFDRACDEFQRILRPRGLFAALWNPALITKNPLLADIAAQIIKLKPDIRRAMSGRPGRGERLTDQLSAKSFFTDVLYLESRHSMRQSPAEFLGSWRALNDLQFQLGPELSTKLLNFIAERTVGVADIETTYLTRAWVARRI